MGGGGCKGQLERDQEAVKGRESWKKNVKNKQKKPKKDFYASVLTVSSCFYTYNWEQLGRMPGVLCLVNPVQPACIWNVSRFNLYSQQIVLNILNGKEKLKVWGYRKKCLFPTVSFPISYHRNLEELYCVENGGNKVGKCYSSNITPQSRGQLLMWRLRLAYMK